MLKIVADENIPHVLQWFGQLGDLRAVRSQDITSKTVADADALLVRSTKAVGPYLLKNSRVRLVGTASSGSDHLDTAWLNAQGIVCYDAKGCNAEAVSQYILSSLARLQQWGYLSPGQWRVGLIGLGHVGQCVQQKLQALGCQLLCHDPFKALEDPNWGHTPLEAFNELDVLSLHVPLTTSGSYPTQAMVNDRLLQCLKPGGILINTSRGGVIDPKALWRSGKHVHWCFDVWPDEPDINLALLTRALLATPHIAGYSQLAKKRASLMLLTEVIRYFQLDVKQLPNITQTITERLITADSWQQAVLQVYDPSQDDRAMRRALYGLTDQKGQTFETLRQYYALRPEWLEFTIDSDCPNLDELMQYLGFSSPVAIAK